MPPSVERWVALTAYRLDADEEDAPLTGERYADVSLSYARPSRSKAERLMPDLSVYQLKTGRAL